VGGRYSVFSSVGLFPLALCGVDIEKIMKSAIRMRDNCLNGVSNIAMDSAIILFEHLEKGIAINDNFYFHTELESLGKWYRQLMGESTGKNGRGLTPTVSIGSVDLHSVVQLYLGGPKNKYTSFIYTEIFDNLKLPNINSLTHIQEIEGKMVGDIMSAIQQGTITAYKNARLPHSEVILESICIEEVVSYMQFKMIEMMYLGKLMNINAFDQPQVELYKIETKKILAKK
jgi:glucose-6-phosphate isomerase